MLMGDPQLQVGDGERGMSIKVFTRCHVVFFSFSKLIT